MTLTDLYAEHWDLMEASDLLLRMLDRDARPLSHEIAAMRWQLSVMTEQHLAHERQVVRRPLEQSDDPNARFLGRVYADELNELRRASARHRARWNPAAIDADWAGYRAAATRRVAALKRRIEWEEREIFPVVAALAAQRLEVVWI